MKYFNNITVFALFLFLGYSCSRMNDIQEIYANREEAIYLGRVDSVEAFPGLNRVKLTWYNSADPRINNTIIYWNMRQDSVVKEFLRKEAGVVKDSIIISDLPEGTVNFEFKNVDEAGNSSLFSTASADVWGLNFIKGLNSRNIQEINYEETQSILHLELSPTFSGDNIIFSEIVFPNNEDQEERVKIEREEVFVLLTDFSEDTEFQFRTAFFLSNGIDTVYSDFEVFNIP